MKLLLSGLQLNSGNDLLPYLDLLQSVVCIYDEYTRLRFDNLFGFPHPRIIDNHQFPIKKSLLEPIHLYIPANQDVTSPQKGVSLKSFMNILVDRHK